VSGSSHEFSKGDSAVVAPVPELDSVVGRWRARFDRSAEQGMPAHLSVLVPWIADADINDQALTQLADAVGRTPMEVTFREFGELPGLLYLRPEPAAALVEMTRRIESAWPSHLHHRGAFDDVLPHLTVAVGASAAEREEITADVRPLLPLTAKLTAIWIVVFDGARWERRATLPLHP